MTEKLQDCCIDLVKFKDSLDLLGRNQRAGGKAIIKAMVKANLKAPEHGWSAMTPGTFCMCVLPYCEPFQDLDSMRLTEIQTNLIISGTYNDYSPNDTNWGGKIDPNLIMNNSDKTAQDSAHPQCPRYAKIGSLPLYVALEGKNRVSLFKQFRKTMMAQITETDYPLPNKLSFIQFWPFNDFGVAYQDEVEILPFPDITIPLLQAYGVSKKKKVVDFLSRSKRNKRIHRVCSSQMVR